MSAKGFIGGRSEGSDGNMNMTTTEQILAMLREAAGDEVSSRAMCDRLGISRAAIWKQIQSLRAGGYVIAACSRRGYCLRTAPDTPCAAEVLPLLTTRRVGRDCRYLTETGSTNHDVAALALAGAEEGLVAAAGAQTAGRGRMTREWYSPQGVNLYFSVLLRPPVEPGRVASLPLVAGLAVAEALAELAPETRPQVKWPNDILINDKKVCGILCEMQAETDCVRHLIPGIGVNLNLTREALPEELRGRATSLLIETGRPFSRAVVMASILNRFEPLYDRWCAEGFEPLLGAIGARDALRGRSVAVDQGGRQVSGVADGILPDGALRLLTDHGAVPVYSGEAHIGGLG
jgi:BirA family biotin operon repressor/biotin-[acetyl-CoA-carboxylase] ligase